MLEFLVKELYEPLKERGKRVALEFICFALVVLAAVWLTSGEPARTRLLSLSSVAVAALWYVGLARRVEWRRVALGLALTATAMWCFGAWYVRTAGERHVADAFRMAERLQKRGFYIAARDKLQVECGSRRGPECSCRLGALDAHLGDTRSARKSFLTCMATAVERDDVVWQTVALVDLGDLEEQTDQNGLATKYFTDALALAEASSSDYGIYRAKRGLAMLAAKSGRYGEARAFASAAMAIAARDGEEAAAAEMHVLLGEYDLLQGAGVSALSHLASASSAYEAVGDPHGRMVVQWHVAELHRREGLLEVAREEYKRALGGLQQWQDAQGQAEVLLALADVERQAKRYGLAREFFDEALRLFRSIGDSLGEANTLIELAHMEVRVGSREAARELYERARVLCQRAESSNSEANALRGMADLERLELAADRKAEAAQIRRATDYLAEARQLYQANGNLLGQANVDLTEAMLLGQVGRNAESAELWARAGEVYRRLGMGAWAKRLGEDVESQLRAEDIPLQGAKKPTAR